MFERGKSKKSGFASRCVQVSWFCISMRRLILATYVTVEIWRTRRANEKMIPRFDYVVLPYIISYVAFQCVSHWSRSYVFLFLAHPFHLEIGAKMGTKMKAYKDKIYG